MKKFIRFAAFLIIAAVIFCFLDRLLVRKELFGWWNITTKTNGFFNSAKDEYDVVFCGSSHSYCSFNPLVIYEQTGLNSYVTATQKQPFWATYYYIKEAINRQHPAIIVLDCYMASKNDDYTDDATNYTFCDDFPLGINKLKLVNVSAPQEKRFDLLVRFTKYHSRWSELDSDDFGFRPEKLKDWLNGYCMLTSTNPNVLAPSSGGFDGTIPLSEKNEEWLINIINLCRENSVRLLIVKTPSNETAEERGYYNSVEKIAEENGIEYINFNDLYTQIGLDMSRDFFDGAHLNCFGADKFSRYFASYLDTEPRKDDYDFSSRLIRYYRELSGDYMVFKTSHEFLK